MVVNPQPKIFNIVPGNSADVDEIQEEASPEIVNWTNFFPSIYEVPRKSGGLSPERRTVNTIFKDYGGHLYFMQRGGIYAYDASQKYAKGSVIQHGGSLYAAIADNGSGTSVGAVTPGSNTSVWQKLLIETSLSGYAKAAWVSANYELQSHAAATYATIVWVNGNFAQKSWVSSNFALSSWVSSYFLTKSDAQKTYATISWSNSIFAAASWVNSYFLTKSAAQQTYGTISWINTLDANAVHKSGNETINGVKTFRQTIQGNLSGNAQTATTWQTARTITLSNAVSATAQWINGSGNVNIPVNSLDASKLTGTASVDTTGRAARATKADSDKNGKDITKYVLNIRSNISLGQLYVDYGTGLTITHRIATYEYPMSHAYNGIGSTIVAQLSSATDSDLQYGATVAGSRITRGWGFDNDGGQGGGTPSCAGTWVRVCGFSGKGRTIGVWRRIA